MIRTGEGYIASIREGREIYINGERVKDVTTQVSGQGAFLGTRTAAVSPNRRVHYANA